VVSGHPVEKLYREVALRIYEGATESAEADHQREALKTT
jgi:hypothetical protein